MNIKENPKKCNTPSINHTDVIFNDKDLPICCGLWAFGTPWMSSLNDTDFSNDTDLSGNNENVYSYLCEDEKTLWKGSGRDEIKEQRRSKWCHKNLCNLYKCINNKEKQRKYTWTVRESSDWGYTATCMT